MPRDSNPVTRPPLRVLVVDDHAAARTVVTRVLRKEPDLVVVGQASNGQEALEHIAKSEPDLVLLDVRMPVLDGVATAQIIRRDFPHVRVIGMSVGPHDPAAQAMGRAGAVAYVSKQDIPALLTAIRHGRPLRPAASRRAEPRLTRALYRQHRLHLSRVTRGVWAITVVAPDGMTERLLGQFDTPERARRTAEEYIDRVIQDQAGPQSGTG